MSIVQTSLGNDTKRRNRIMKKIGAKSRYIDSKPDEDWSQLGIAKEADKEDDRRTAGLPDEAVPSDVRARANMHDRRLAARLAEMEVELRPSVKEKGRLHNVKVMLSYHEGAGYVPEHLIKEYKELTGVDYVRP